MRLFSLCVILLFSLALSSCFMVRNFGEYWDKGELDPILQNHWKDVFSGKKVTIVKRGNDYAYADEKDPTRIRTLRAGDATYLMLKNAKGGMLLRYAATKDRLVIYGPDPKQRKAFEAILQPRMNPRISQEPNSGAAMVSMLDKNTVAMLEKAASVRDLWLEKVIFETYSPEKEAAKEKEEFEAPDPFAPLREKYQGVIGVDPNDIMKPEDLMQDIDPEKVIEMKLEEDKAAKAVKQPEATTPITEAPKGEAIRDPRRE